MQGESVEFSDAEKAIYEEVVSENATRLHLADCDAVVVHDPQPLPLVSHFAERRMPWLWQCHIDLSSPNPAVWSYLREFGFADGARRFTAAIQRFAAANGKPNLYHATITWAYLVVINERMQRDASEWETFANANEDLFAWKPSLIDAWYRPETLASDYARRVFIFPDRVTVFEKAS